MTENNFLQVTFPCPKCSKSVRMNVDETLEDHLCFEKPELCPNHNRYSPCPVCGEKWKENISDTEWGEKVRDWWYRLQDYCSGMMHSLPEACRVEIEHIIKETLTSRDTYWKERVRKERQSELELLAMHLDRQLAGYTNVSVESVYNYIEQRHKAITNEDNLK